MARLVARHFHRRPLSSQLYSGLPSAASSGGSAALILDATQSRAYDGAHLWVHPAVEIAELPGGKGRGLVLNGALPRA